MSYARRLIPLADRILVRRVQVQSTTKTSSGLFLPETAVSEHTEGEVISTGPGARDQNGNIIPLNVAPGDRVLIPNFGGHKFTFDNEEFSLFRESEILAKFESA